VISFTFRSLYPGSETCNVFHRSKTDILDSIRIPGLHFYFRLFCVCVVGRDHIQVFLLDIF